MKKHLLFLSVLFLSFAGLHAQHFVKAIYSGTHYLTCNVQSLGGQGSLVSGVYTDTVTNLFYDLIIRYDASGHLIWAKGFGPKAYYTDFDVKQTADGNYIAASHTAQDTCSIYKLNSNGGLVWSKAYKIGNTFSITAVRELSNQNYLIAGSYDLSFSETRVYELQVTSTGTLVSFKGFRCNESARATLRDAIKTSDNNLLLVGEITNAALYHDIFLLKTTYSGTVLWAKRIDLDTTEIFPQHVYEQGNGSFKITAGNYSSGNDVNNAFIITTDQSGAYQSAKRITTPSGSIIISNSAQATDGSILFTGSDYGAGYKVTAVKIDASGNVAFRKQYSLSGQDFASSITELDGGDLLLGVTIAPLTWNRGGGLLDMAILRTNADGSLACFTSDSTATIANRPLAQCHHFY